MKNKNFFAVDIGASSGRTIIGTLENGILKIKELTRFRNAIVEINGHFYWNLVSLYESIIDGLKEAKRSNIEISSIGIDTWGVDFIAIDKNKEIVGMPYSYRDPHTANAPEEFFKIVPRKDVYKATGIQIMNFNSLFQFFTLKQNNSTMLREADKILFMPDGLAFMLTGEAVMEYTIASTAQMLNPYTKQPDEKLLAHTGLSAANFGRLVMPGTIIGNLSEAICKQVGFDKPIPVVAVAGHDTASAVAAVPAQENGFAYLSSGTWSLMGIEVAEPIITEETYTQNFTNEGGVDGTIRFLKNICGMWLLEQCIKEWNSNKSYPELIEEAKASKPFQFIIDPDEAVFANPVKMTEAIAEYCKKTNQGEPASIGEFVRCIFESLALRYKEVFDILQNLSPSPLTKLHVIGGGSKNNLLNQFTSNALNVPVVAGPSEATAKGNIMLQAKALGIVNSLSEMRGVLCNSVQLIEFKPNDTAVWDEGYKKYKEVKELYNK